MSIGDAVVGAVAERSERLVDLTSTAANQAAARTSSAAAQAAGSAADVAATAEGLARRVVGRPEPRRGKGWLTVIALLAAVGVSVAVVRWWTARKQAPTTPVSARPSDSPEATAAAS